MTNRILTITLNPAIDVTYRVEALRVGETVRVPQVRSRAGGKGVNVAAVVNALGGDSLVLALTTTAVPDEFRAGLLELRIVHRLVPAFASVRRTVAVVADDGTTTMLQENGFPADEGAEAAIVHVLRDELETGVGAVVISGSVPVGMNADVPARLTKLCAEFRVPVIADVSGPALRAVAHSGAVLMPNGDELVELDGGRSGVAACHDLVAGGAAAVVATAGPDGAVAVTAAGGWQARPVEVVAGNPAGAGDAAAAALALHLAAAGQVQDVDWSVALADVVATSAAAVLRPVAGEIDLEARARWIPLTTVKET